MSSVEPFHLDRYVAEQVFRYNNRATKDNPLNDADRFLLVECPANFVPVENIRNWHERSWRWHEARGINRSK